MKPLPGSRPRPRSCFSPIPKAGHPFCSDQVRALAETRHALTVAMENGKVVGFADLYDLTERWAFIGNVIIARASRGQGRGKILVRHMVNTAMETYGVPEVRISVFAHNTPALLLYSRLKFRPYAVEERSDPSGKPVVLLHMRLGQA